MALPVLDDSPSVEYPTTAPKTPAVDRSSSSYPPAATCPPGERLYRVSRGGESQYVSAGSEEEAAEQLGYKAGYSAFVTSVMSPEAYPGGVYPTSKEVTAVSGEKFVVPTEPKLEATREYARLYGSVPSTNAPEALKASYQEQREVIQSQMEAGTYVSPLSIEIPEVKALAEKNNLSYSQALTEAKLVADQAIRNYSTTGSCGRLGMTLGEAKISSAYLSAIGRTDEADIIRQYYVGLGGTLENQLKKAEDVDLYGVYKDLKPYRKGVSYDLVTACSEGACSESGLKLMGFSPGIIASSMAMGGILGSLQGSKFYNSATGEVMLGPAIAAGVITETQARQVFGKEDVDTALKYVEPVSYQPIGKIALGKGEKPLSDEFIQQLKFAGTMGYLLPPREPSGSFVSTQTTKWGLPTVITPEQVGLLEQSLGRAPTRTEFISAFGEVPNLPSPYMDVPTSKLYSQLYPQYVGAKYAAIEVGASMLPAVRAAYPQVSIKEITPAEWAVTGVQVALLGYGAYSGLSPLIRAQGGIRGVVGQLATSERGGGFVVGSKGIGFSRIEPLVQAKGLIYEPVGTTLKSVGPAQRLYTGIVREGPVTLKQLAGYKPITGTKVFGEMGYRPTTIYGPLSKLPRISPSVMVSGGLKVPTTGFAGPGVFGPEIPIYPLEPIRGGGGIGIRTPLKPLVGLPYVPSSPLTKTAYQTVGVTYPSVISIPFKVTTPIKITSPSPFISPVISPFVSPLVSPMPAPVTIPKTTPITLPKTWPIVGPSYSPFVQPSTYTGFGPGYTPSPVPTPTPIPVPVPIPTPTPVIVIPTPVPPGGGGGGSGGGGSFWWPSFGVGGLKSSRPFVLGKGGILGIGKWKFSGFKVSGPHPLALGTTGYTWMGGKEAAWGAKREAAPKKSRGLATGGLVRVV